MSSKNLHGDVNYAWPGGEVAVMGADGAVNIIHRRELAKADDPEELRAKLVEEYKDPSHEPLRRGEPRRDRRRYRAHRNEAQDHRGAGDAPEQARGPAREEARDDTPVTGGESRGDVSVIPILMAAVRAYLEQEETGAHGSPKLNAWKRAALRPVRKSQRPSQLWMEAGWMIPSASRSIQETIGCPPLSG